MHTEGECVRDGHWAPASRRLYLMRRRIQRLLWQRLRLHSAHAGTKQSLCIAGFFFCWSSRSAFSGCRALLCVIFCLLWTPACRGLPLVVSPSQAIVATVGDNITLPCQLKPEMDANLMRVEWARPDLNPGFVHEWADKKEYVMNQQSSYRGRTSLIIDKLEHGDISLKLFNVRISDEGTYRCLVPQVGQEAFIKLVVGVASSPHITVTNETSSSMVLQCESAGWYPEPELLWLDGEGKLLSAGTTTTLRRPDDLYTVSSRMTVHRTHSNNFTCKVQQKSINQSREAHFDVPALPSNVKIVLVLGFLAVLCALLLLCRGQPRPTYPRYPAYVENQAMVQKIEV